MAAFDLRDELQALQDPSPDDDQLDADEIPALLEGAVESVAESSDNIRDAQVFDVYRRLLKHSDVVPGPTMTKLLDSLSSGLQAELDATVRDLESEPPQVYLMHKTPLEMYAFLLQWFVSAVEKVKESDDAPATPAPKPRRGRGGKQAATSRSARSKKSEWTWSDQIPATLNLISKVLRLSTTRIWTTTAERDTFISCLTRLAYHVTESEVYMKSQDIKLSVYKVLCLAVKHHGHALAAQITIIQSLQFYEHLSEPMAECLTILAKEFDHAQLGDEVLREIASMTFGGQDNKGPRYFSRFLIKFSELAPRLMLKQMSLLLGQLDSEAYPIRIAVVEVIAAIIQDLGDSEDDESGDGSQKKQINGLYDLLLERALDVSSYVRTKVLAALARLCDMKRAKFPKQRLAVTQVAVGALEDKVASVRKGAVALLIRLLLTHPYGLMYGGMLTLDKWEEDYRDLKAQLAKLEAKASDADAVREQEEEEAPERTNNSMDVDGDTDKEEDEEEEDESAMTIDEEDAERTPKKKKKRPSKLKPRKSQIAIDMTSEKAALDALETNALLHLRLRKKYYAEALNFIRQIEGTMETMERLLGSKSKPEVLEAIEFFRVAHEYKFASAEDGIKKMLHLIWVKDNSSSGGAAGEDGAEVKGVRQRLLECYRGLYFDPIAGMEPKAQVNRIAKNMIELTYNATLAELTSLEEMMRIMMDEDQIHPDVIAKLWSVYSIQKALPKAQRQGAIIILGMLALAKRGVLTDHVDVMLKVGLGHLGKADLTLARYTCVALQRLNGSAKKIKGSLHDKTIRIGMDNPIFQKLQEAVEHPSRSKEWFGLAEQAINTAYALGEHPDVLCNDLIRKLTVRALGSRVKTAAASQEERQEPGEGEKDLDAMDEDPPENISRGSQDSGKNATPPSGDVGDAFELSQLLFVVGHVAIKHIVYLELVEREWKRQKDEKDGAEKQANTAKGKEREELDQVAGNAEDEIGERIAAVRETELLYGPQSLLAIYGPMLVHICGSPHKYKNRTLRAAATLSFSKFLCVSSQFCDQNHLLLFKILETSKNANIRSNIVIALGDVAVSFSSIIDENSNELYKGLSDTDLVVKKNTLMVLTHLILNGMIKVKGQLGEMAKCIEDPEPRISDLAKLFFKELSTKDNAIYNNLPDVISHLGIGEHAVDEETFQRTLTYIFSFIEKEKQAESIVEKLCQRFHLSEEPRQWRDIAFCLSLLPFKSERSVKKLIEGLPFYRDKLHEETVYERFSEILNKARQNKSANKPDTELAEFEQILEDNRMQGEEDRDLEKRVQGKKAAAKKKASKKKGRKKVVRVEEDSEPEE